MSQHISRVSLDNSLPSAQLHLILQEDFRKFFYVLYNAQQIAPTCFAELSHSLAGPSHDAFDVFLQLIFFPFLMTFFPLLDDFLPLSSSSLAVGLIHLTERGCLVWVGPFRCGDLRGDR